MPRRKFIDRKTATTFALVHRAQNDPLIHDEDAPSMVFAERPASQHPRRPTDDDYAYSSARSMVSDSSYQSLKTKHRGDLDDEFGLSFRSNEGQAAQHGVFYDDTEYDYMQHMRDLGGGEGPVTWVESSGPPKKKGKERQTLADALREVDLEDGQRSAMGSVTSDAARSLLPEDVLPSDFVRRVTYQDQQDVPDEIAGFQPDMDPRLREVLEALDDEEYVDDEEDVFAELTKDGYEVDKDEWDRLGDQGELDDEDDEGWESDDTIKGARSLSDMPAPPIFSGTGETAKPPDDAHAQPPADPTEGAWLGEFQKFKTDVKNSQAHKPALDAPSMQESSALPSLASTHRKKRKGAKTSTTNYSMTSSSIARTDHQTLLDDRFDKMEEAYSLAEFPDDEELDESASAMSGMTGLSKSSKMSKYSNASGLSGVSGVSSYSRASDIDAPKLVRSDLDGIMDEFLGEYSKSGKHGRRVKRVGPQSGMAQLDEIRAGLGPARLKSRTSAATGAS